ncbi:MULTISPECIES: VOC family protein [Kribbella]|uniref:VOC family protein n=1 Tax=Kribbella karoonensis TaxID=324851 RepID=A0ABN2E9A2_9ACTN
MTTTQGVQTILHPVTDLEKAKPVYAALLGVEPVADSPYYVGFEAAGQQIGLVPNSDMTAPVAHWHVTDIEDRIKAIVEAGGTLKSPPKDVSNGRLVALVTDPDGNVLGLLQDPS